uniref:Uncharacterized protein n=1 Tax=Anopheles dirus TaxID=7168 RepID=A0A182N9C6_9DIPT
MKYTFAFVLLALFAVLTVSQAKPLDEEAAPTNDEGSDKVTVQLQLTKEELADLEKVMGGRYYDWRYAMAGAYGGNPYYYG